MKLLRIVPFVLVLAAGVSSTSYADTQKGSGSAPSGGAVSDADVKKWLAFWDKLVDVFVSDKGQCGKMGTDLNALVDANKDLMAHAQKAVADGKQLPADARQHMKDTLPKIIGGAMSCKDDATVKAGMQRLKFTRQQSQ
jgi:hypothetical protein